MSCIFVPFPDPPSPTACGGRRLRVLLSHVSASSSSSSSSSDVRSRVTPAEWRLREDLAAAYHIAAKEGWDELIYNHITVRVNDDDDGDDAAGTRPPEFLINPFGLSFAEVTASSLVKIDLEGRVVDPGSTGRPVNVAGFVIHSAVHAARDDLHCVWHTHHSPTVAVSAMKAGFLPLSQEACIIMPRMSAKTHPFEGIAVDTGERERIVAALDGKQCVLLQNHGVVCGGRTVQEAFWNVHLVARAAEIQCEAMRAVGGRLSELHQPPPLVVEQTVTRAEKAFEAQGNADWGKLEFAAAVRKLSGSFRA